AVPADTSWTGSPVDLELSWGALPPPCPGFGVACQGEYPKSSVQVYDCGATPCASNQTYPLLVSTNPAPGGNTEINATPGEHYQVWAWAGSLAPSNTTIRVRSAVDGPLFDGVFGAAMVGFGIEAAVVGAVQWRLERRKVRMLAAWV
ncbi:MAG: hypothetical protein L3K18_01535, partial [Thermoplasmata archaeon]|nr:hypothetical protein [Thermoplasmata archaeon]